MNMLEDKCFGFSVDLPFDRRFSLFTRTDVTEPPSDELLALDVAFELLPALPPEPAVVVRHLRSIADTFFTRKTPLCVPLYQLMLSVSEYLSPEMPQLQVQS